MRRSERHVDGLPPRRKGKPDSDIFRIRGVTGCIVGKLHAHCGNMRASLDGVILTLDRPTLRAALEAGIAAAEAKGAMVVGVVADGAEIPQSELEDPSDTELREGGFQLIELTSVRPAALVARTLRDAAGAIDGLIASQEQAAAAIQAGDVQKGLSDLQEVFMTWQIIRDVVSRGGGVLKRDLAAIPSLPGIDAKEPVALCLSALIHTLKEVKKAVDTEDWSALSDQVGYTLDAMAKDWKVVLSALAEHVERSFEHQSGGDPSAGGGGGGGGRAENKPGGVG